MIRTLGISLACAILSISTVQAVAQWTVESKSFPVVTRAECEAAVENSVEVKVNRIDEKMHLTTYLHDGKYYKLTVIEIEDLNKKYMMGCVGMEVKMVAGE